QMKEGKFKEYAKLFRLPSSLGISIVGVIGALSVKNANLDFSILIILLVMGVIGNIFGYVLNDYLDSKFDRLTKDLSDRPLVKGTVTEKNALAIIIISSIAIFVIPSIFFRSILLIFILIISVVLGIFYDLFCKKIVCSEFFLAGAMASFCLFGAVAVTGDIKSFNELGSLTWIVVTLMFIYVFIMDAFEGNFKDVENDRKAGAVTLPVYLGVKSSSKIKVPLCYKVLLIFFKFVIIFLIFIPFIFLEYSYWNWQILILVLLAFGMVWSMIKILNIGSFDRQRIAIYSRRHGVLSYFVFPFILIRFIGFEWAIFLIFYPVIWPLIFNYILYGKSLTPAAYVK
ncbi:MAG: UbiA prenyltransferase family protein, partial [Thermoplasmatales archaeon]